MATMMPRKLNMKEETKPLERLVRHTAPDQESQHLNRPRR